MAIFRRLVFHRITSIFGGRLRYLISGSAPLRNEINHFLAAAEVPIVEGYGLTEAAPVVSVNLHGGRTKVGTVGRPLPNVKVKTAPDGELLVSGPNVMTGYFNHDEQTRDQIQKRNVIALKADLTDHTAPGWKLLNELGGTGIPFTAIFPPAANLSGLLRCQRDRPLRLQHLDFERVHRRCAGHGRYRDGGGHVEEHHRSLTHRWDYLLQLRPGRRPGANGKMSSCLISKRTR